MISFEDEHGTEILNPLISSCGRFNVSPDYYGFEKRFVGDRQVAWVKTLNGAEIWLTNKEGEDLPNKEEFWYLSLRTKSGVVITSNQVPSHEDMLSMHGFGALPGKYQSK